MSAKTYNKAPAVINGDVTHAEPFKQWTSFDSFFHEVCRQRGINPKWKAMVEKHLKDKGYFSDQKQWADGLKNFGI